MLTSGTTLSFARCRVPVEIKLPMRACRCTTSNPAGCIPRRSRASWDRFCVRQYARKCLIDVRQPRRNADVRRHRHALGIGSRLPCRAAGAPAVSLGAGGVTLAARIVRVMVKSTSSTEFDARTTTEVVRSAPDRPSLRRRRIHARHAGPLALLNVAAGTPGFVSRGVTDSAPPMFTTADGTAPWHRRFAPSRVLADPPPVAVVQAHHRPTLNVGTGGTTGPGSTTPTSAQVQPVIGGGFAPAVALRSGLVLQKVASRCQMAEPRKSATYVDSRPPRAATTAPAGCVPVPNTPPGYSYFARSSAPSGRPGYGARKEAHDDAIPPVRHGGYASRTGAITSRATDRVRWVLRVARKADSPDGRAAAR